MALWDPRFFPSVPDGPHFGDPHHWGRALLGRYPEEDNEAFPLPAESVPALLPAHGGHYRVLACP